ncbi:alpha/beta fold hydrolase [Nocardioides litoris]|uniref:alpha/beta fold hydrolase n=1 Tax=Nocardioides litoris TaxID=1926648 RepID=UPI0011201130|nr:alpha/beta hydrolase [Nocardioides litoris]
MADPVLPGFDEVDVAVDGDEGSVRIHARVGGSGPPVLLLHGYPQTSAMWHSVAPALAGTHTVVAADLRGYGRSERPASSADHTAYGKRAMAADQVGLMRALGHERFAVVGHDRGARVTHRMCLDHPDAVTRAAVLDIAPTRHVLGHVDRLLAQVYEHWFFLSQETDVPETLVGAAPEHYLRAKLAAWSGEGAVFDEAALQEYVDCFDAASVHATCEDYRAGVTCDLALDDADHAAGLRVTCPLLVLWGAAGFVGLAYDALAVWRDHHADPALVTGHGVPGGHFVPEEAPAEVLAALRAFLGD